MRAFLIPLVATFGVAFASTPEPVTSVTVRDADFAEVKVLDTDELGRFTRMWAAKRPVDVPQAVGGTHYKIDIGTGGRSQRYLYYSSGLGHAAGQGRAAGLPGRRPGHVQPAHRRGGVRKGGQGESAL